MTRTRKQAFKRVEMTLAFLSSEINQHREAELLEPQLFKHLGQSLMIFQTNVSLNSQQRSFATVNEKISEK